MATLKATLNFSAQDFPAGSAVTHIRVMVFASDGTEVATITRDIAPQVNISVPNLSADIYTVKAQAMKASEPVGDELVAQRSLAEDVTLLVPTSISFP